MYAAYLHPIQGLKVVHVIYRQHAWIYSRHDGQGIRVDVVVEQGGIVGRDEGVASPNE